MNQIELDLMLYSKFEEMIERRLAEIPVHKVEGPYSDDKPEDVADWHFVQQGYKVFHSRARGGYRCCVDAPVYWNKLSKEDRETVELIKTSIPLNEWILFVKAIRDKVGTPDLLLLKDGKLSFVEVKAKRELIQPCTVKFYLLYAHIWPISILRVVLPAKGLDENAHLAQG